MKQTIFWLVCGALITACVVIAAPAKKIKNYEGVITQVNYGDNSFVMRLRDGNLVTVKSPLTIDMFMSVRGALDATNKIITDVTELKVKDSNGADAMPIITLLNPGSATVNTDITITGTGFTKKNNHINIGDVQNAAINLPSKDKKTIVFRLPPNLCNKKSKTKCAVKVPSEGDYNITVSNEHGISNPVSFHIVPLPPLAITTTSLPQVVAGTLYKMPIAVRGGAYPYEWLISGGLIPPGLTLDAAGTIIGLPTTPGTYSFTVMITSGTETVTKQFSITVVQSLSS